MTCRFLSSGIIPCPCWGEMLDAEDFSVPKEGVFKAVSMGTNHACAIRADDQVVCWGKNAFGEAPP